MRPDTCAVSTYKFFGTDADVAVAASLKTLRRSTQLSCGWFSDGVLTGPTANNPACA